MKRYLAELKSMNLHLWQLMQQNGQFYRHRLQFVFISESYQPVQECEVAGYFHILARFIAVISLVVKLLSSLLVSHSIKHD